MRGSNSRKKPSLFKKVGRCLAWAAAASLLLLFLLQLPALVQRLRLSWMQKQVRALQDQRVCPPPIEGLFDVRGAIRVYSPSTPRASGAAPSVLDAALRNGIRFLVSSDPPEKAPVRDEPSPRLETTDAVLFIPCAELALPQGDLLVIGVGESELSPSDSLESAAEKAKKRGGLLFLCSSGDDLDWDKAVHGAELVSLHADLQDESLPQLFAKLLHSWKRYPDLCFQEIHDHPGEQLARWDEVLSKRTFVAIAGNDARGNLGIRFLNADPPSVRAVRGDGEPVGESLPQAISKALRLLDRDPKDDLVCEFVLDTYPHSFSYISTRALVSELSESAVLDALGKGRCYICYEALGDPQGFRFQALGKGQKALMGGSLPHQHGLELEIASPIPCVLRLLKDGKTVGKTEGRGLIHRVEGPGVYRAEAWLRLLDTERLWLFTNPIYVTG